VVWWSFVSKSRKKSGKKNIPKNDSKGKNMRVGKK
jgi:hypothetical protein